MEVHKLLVGNTHSLGSKMIADLILTYGMATRVRRLPVIPTVMTSVLFTAKPSLPSVISCGWQSLWFMPILPPVHSVSTLHEISLTSFGNIVTDMADFKLAVVKLSLDLSLETGVTRRRCLWLDRGVKLLFANDSAALKLVLTYSLRILGTMRPFDPSNSTRRASIKLGAFSFT